MMLIDVHAHYGRWFFPSNCESAKDISELCDRFGIEKIALSSSRAILYDMESGNREMCRILAEDDRFLAYVYLNPAQPEESAREMERYLGHPRFVGVKLHPSYSGRSANTEATKELVAGLPEGKVVLVHTWGPAEVDHVCDLAASAPGCAIIMGHMGGTAEEGWQAAARAALRQPNLHLEICGSLLHIDRIRDVIGAVGSARVLFGSDLTLISPAFAIGQVLDSEISEEDKISILHDNAARLFGVSNRACPGSVSGP